MVYEMSEYSDLTGADEINRAAFFIIVDEYLVMWSRY